MSLIQILTWFSLALSGKSRKSSKARVSRSRYCRCPLQGYCFTAPFTSTFIWALVSVLLPLLRNITCP